MADLYRPLSDVLEEALAEAELRAEYPELSGLRTGIAAFDDAASPALVPGRLIVVAGESGRGKTAFAAQIVAAFGMQTGVLWLSLEDDARDAVNRQLANVSRLSVGDIRSGAAWRESQAALGAAALHLDQLRVDVVDQVAVTVEQIAQLAWKWQQERGVEHGVLVIDQLSHIAPSIPGDPEAWVRRGLPAPPPVNGPETNRLEWQVAVLKLVAMRLGLTIVLLHQLNEAHGKGQEPDDRSIRGSRGITHKADLVVIPWVPSKVESPFAGPGQPGLVSNDSGDGYLIGVKARTVGRFKVPVRWDGPHQRWADRDEAPGAPYVAPAAPSARAIEGARKLADLRATFEARRREQLEAASRPEIEA